MITLSTHVLDAARGGGTPDVQVTVKDSSGLVVGSGLTGADGRVSELASGLEPGRYRIEWDLKGTFVRAVATEVELSEDRHYHVPLLASPFAAVVYLGV